MGVSKIGIRLGKIFRNGCHYDGNGRKPPLRGIEMFEVMAVSFLVEGFIQFTAF